MQGIDSATPYATLGHRIFRGSYEETVGSTLVFDRAALKRSASDAPMGGDQPEHLPDSGARDPVAVDSDGR